MQAFRPMATFGRPVADRVLRGRSRTAAGPIFLPGRSDESAPTIREQNAARALREEMRLFSGGVREATTGEHGTARVLRAAATFLLFWPLQVYVFYLLLKVFVSNERLGPEYRHMAQAAAAINLLLSVFLCLALRLLASVVG